MEFMKIYICSDHGGFKLKEELKGYLSELGFEVEDMGAHSLVDGDDYPDYVIPVALRVVSNRTSSPQGKLHETLGVVIGRSGNGEVIAANKVKGVRAALCVSPEHAQKARSDNDANILSLGADFMDAEVAREVVKTFLETPFSDAERHARRVQKITDYENKSS